MYGLCSRNTIGNTYQLVMMDVEFGTLTGSGLTRVLVLVLLGISSIEI